MLAGADLEERIAALIRTLRLGVDAWSLADDVETTMWYACRGEPACLRREATRLARLTVLARLVGLPRAEYELFTRVPENLHEIFMRAELPVPQRSRAYRRLSRADHSAAHQADPVWPPASFG